MEAHTDDIRTVHQGDSVTIETSQGVTYTGSCEERMTHHPSERSGEVREQTIWTFRLDGQPGEVHCSIVDGLKSSPDGKEFPQHVELFAFRDEERLGYVENVEVSSIAQA